jgi:hypothetical protein
MEDLDQNTEPREDTTWEPKSLSLMVKHPSRITVSNTKLQLKVGVLRQPCPKTVLSLPWFLQHSIGQSWCSSRVSNDFLRISFGYSSYPLHDVSLFYSSHISSVHVQKPSTFASEPLDERHLFSVDNVFISLHPVLWCSSYSVSSSSCTSRFLQFLFHVVLFSSLLPQDLLISVLLDLFVRFGGISLGTYRTLCVFGNVPTLTIKLDRLMIVSNQAFSAGFCMYH